MSETNKKLVRRHSEEIFNRKDLAVADELMAEHWATREDLVAMLQLGWSSRPAGRRPSVDRDHADDRRCTRRPDAPATGRAGVGTVGPGHARPGRDRLVGSVAAAMACSGFILLLTRPGSCHRPAGAGG
jgi:hypothetical protein